MTAASQVPLDHALVLASALFAIGLGGIVARRNLVFVLMAIEVMLNAGGLVFVAAGASWGEAGGQAMFVLVLAVAASEVAIGLALLLLIRRRFGAVDGDGVRLMRG